MRAEKNNESGFTFIELIIALGIVSFLLVSFFSVLANSFSGIKTVGLQKKEIYRVQQMAEQSLLEPAQDGEEQMYIRFPAAGIELPVAGETAVVQDSAGYGSFQITIFKPNIP